MKADTARTIYWKLKRGREITCCQKYRLLPQRQTKSDWRRDGVCSWKRGVVKYCKGDFRKSNLISTASRGRCRQDWCSWTVRQTWGVRPMGNVRQRWGDGGEMQPEQSAATTSSALHVLLLYPQFIFPWAFLLFCPILSPACIVCAASWTRRVVEFKQLLLHFCHFSNQVSISGQNMTRKVIKHGATKFTLVSLCNFII